MDKRLISIVISAFNEEGNIEKLHHELDRVLATMTNFLVEIIFVNDGSTDSTYQKCCDVQGKDKRVRIVNFTRNFGHEIAMTAGMDYAKGDCIIFMDADLQHPPEYVPLMVQEWQNGHDCVLTRRVQNQDTSKLYQFAARMFYKTLNLLSDTKITEQMPDFRLLDRKYVDFLKSFNEHDRMFRGLLNWMLDLKNLKVIDFVAPERFAGDSKYTFSKAMKLAFDALLQFSIKPLRFAVYLGTATAFIAVILALHAIIEHYILDNPTPGYATLMVTITTLGAMQLLVLWIIGEYVGKIHLEVKNRPLYLANVKEDTK